MSVQEPRGNLTPLEQALVRVARAEQMKANPESLLDLTPEEAVALPEVAAVLDGSAHYDGLSSGAEQALVREIRNARVAATRARLNFKAEFLEAGQSWAEWDETEGSSVIRNRSAEDWLATFPPLTEEQKANLLRVREEIDEGFAKDVREMSAGSTDDDGLLD